MMETFYTVADIRQLVSSWKSAGKRVAFVPTMGNLHAGHLALVEVARQQADKVIASIFVNPTQFGPSEDFDGYPRTLAADQQKLAAGHCDALFAPSVDEMYPRKNLTWVDVDQLGDRLCGANRPGHFRGVTTVVSKLFHIVQPDVACFGEKDFQQLAIIRRMVDDLFFPIDIIGVATVREASGLAMSSRNNYLSNDQQAHSALLQASLQALRSEINGGNHHYRELESKYSQTLEEQGLQVDYLSIAQAHTLCAATTADQQLVVAAAVKVGATRLIDNIPVAVERD